MTEKLFVITASNDEAYRHYIDTIEEGFDIGNVEKFLSDEDLKLVRAIFGGRKIKAWGATSGPGNIRTWQRLENGDKVLIYRKGNYEYFATVVHKFHNRELAEHLWKKDSRGQTWEYVYFLDSVTEISVPVLEFNKVANYASNYFPQGFMQISDGKLASVIKKFGTINELLNYFAEGKWVEIRHDLPKETKEQIIEERVDRQLSHTEILEENLEDIIVENLDKIESGLKLEDRQKVTDVGRIDLLCSDHELVVIELKRGKATTSVIEQIQRYMGWVKENIAGESRDVRGIIVVNKMDTYLKYAVKGNPKLQVKEFKLSFS